MRRSNEIETLLQILLPEGPLDRAISPRRSRPCRQQDHPPWMAETKADVRACVRRFRRELRGDLVPGAERGTDASEIKGDLRAFRRIARHVYENVGGICGTSDRLTLSSPRQQLRLPSG